MTDCPNAAVRDLLPQYAHDRLSTEERAVVEAHLAACDECQAELALIRAASRTLGAAPGVDAERIAGAVRDSLLSARTPPQLRPGARTSRRVVGWRRAAALAAVAVGAVSLAIVRMGGDDAGPLAGGETTQAVAVANAGDEGGDPRQGSSSAPATSVAPGKSVAAAEPDRRELTMAGGVADLSDAALLALLDDIDRLDATPITEPGDLLPALTEEDEEGNIR